MKCLRNKLSYANVVGIFCLFLTLGSGAAFAATQLPANSVGTNQLKSGSVTPKKLNSTATSALTGTPGPLGPAGPTGPVGAQGAQGDRGDKGEKGGSGETGGRGVTGKTGLRGEAGKKGAQGRRGKAGLHTTVNAEFLPRESDRTVVVNCPTGQYATGGGSYSVGADAELIFSGPVPASKTTDGHPTGWQVRYLIGAKQTEVYVTAICGVG